MPSVRSGDDSGRCNSIPPQNMEEPPLWAQELLRQQKSNAQELRGRGNMPGCNYRAVFAFGGTYM